MQDLYSIVLGEGTPLIVLHGFLGMSDNWKTLGRRYAEEGLQVHLVDQRNHGRSFHSDTFNYDVLSEDLKVYLLKKNIPKAIILGHSMGGKTAMQFACTYPELTEKLVVADIAPKFYPPHHQAIINALNTLDFDRITSRKDADEQLAIHIKEWGIRQFLLKNLYWEHKTRLGLRINLPVLSQRMAEIGENINSTASYSGDTLFLRGGRSEYINENDFPEIKRHFPKARLETIENTGHWLHAENPNQFFSLSKEFIDS